MNGRLFFKKYNFLITLFNKVLLFLPLKVRKFIFVKSRMIDGKKGLFIRYVLIKTIAEKCGSNVVIYPNVYILHPEMLVLGSNISIHPMCYLEALGKITIKDNVSIAHNCSILSVTHTWLSEIPIKYNPIECFEVVIHDDVWIGCGARILCGVIINSRSIIAAGAVVTKDVPSNKIFGGIPAREIKNI